MQGDIVNRDQSVCGTCSYWGGERHIITDKYDRVQIDSGLPGRCNAPNIKEHLDTAAMDSCPHWREV